MLVDDEENNFFVMNLFLKKLGLTIDYVNNGESAIDMVYKKQSNEKCDCNYKLIVMDCNMPKMNGW